MVKDFSKEIKDVISQSREIALELGCDHVSTIHLFLADCKINSSHSIKNFVFENETGFQTFYTNQKIAEPIVLAEDIPLTLEAEYAIKKAFKLWNRKKYFDHELRPYHLFLAAAQLPETLFYSIFQNKKELFEKLEQYYIKIGQINKEALNESFWKRLSRKILNWKNDL